jgi:peptide/nickel transport system substrate-binding protein
LLAVALATVVAGCASPLATSSARNEHRVLRLAFADQPRSLNPIYLEGFTGATIDALAFSYLLRPLPDGRLVPDVARVVPTLANGGISRDGRTITYRLRPGVRWQDGAPLTSADVAFTARAVMNPRNTIGSRVPYDRIAGVETPDPATIRIRLREPDAAVPGLFLTPDANAAILPAHLLARFASLDRVAYDAAPVGSGPYRIERWERGSSIRFTRNPTYFGGAPKLGSIELRYAPDTSSTLAQLQTGELDGALEADPALVERYRALAGKRVTNVPYTGAVVLDFNSARPRLADVAMRRALANVVDVEPLVREAFHGSVPAEDATRGLFSYADAPSAPWPRHDPVAAGRTLDALGWRLGPSGMRRRDGKDLVLDLVYANNSVALRVAAVILQQQFARAGVRLDLQSFVYSQFYEPASEGGPLFAGRFDLALVNFSTNVDPDQTWLLACGERAPNGFNFAGFCSPRADALLRASSRAFERSRRVAIVRELQRLVAANVPFLPLWQAREVDVTPLWLHGFTPNGAQPFGSARSWSS